MFAKEKDTFCCIPCDANGHDDHSFVKLHPKNNYMMTKCVRKLNNRQVGKRWTVFYTADDSDDEHDEYVNLDLMCVIMDEEKNLWCQVISKEEENFEEINHGDNYVLVDVNNFDITISNMKNNNNNNNNNVYVHDIYTPILKVFSEKNEFR